MSPLTVLSPHRDDAVFSLAISMKRWCAADVSVRVVNFFTVSAYAPRAVAGMEPIRDDAFRISNLRLREDRRTLAKVDNKLKVVDLKLLDAPLRLNVPAQAVSGPAAVRPIATDIETVERLLHPLLRRYCTIAPLGLGEHVDHKTVRAAAIAAVGCTKWLAFYEDLPYATWTPEESIRETVACIESVTRARLSPICLRSTYSVRHKQRLAQRYESQITASDAETIAVYAEKYNGRERIWVPEHSAQWIALTS